jgi:hypothetical protein
LADLIQDKGYGEYPYMPGNEPPSPAPSKNENWLVLAAILIFGTAILMYLLQLRRTI